MSPGSASSSRWCRPWEAQVLGQVLGSPPCTWESRTKLLAWAWPRPGYCGHLGIDKQMEDLFLFLLTTFFVFNFKKSIFLPLPHPPLCLATALMLTSWLEMLQVGCTGKGEKITPWLLYLHPPPRFLETSLEKMAHPLRNKRSNTSIKYEQNAAG